MWRLYQYPLCPFSRKVRLALAEKGVEVELVEELPWARRDEFIDMNPAGQTPVLVGERGAVRAAPDGGALRTAGRNLENHLGYIEYLLDHRRWLSGPTIGLADLAAAAHLSVVDYLSALDWRGHATAKQWYSAIKSRPAFRILLTERMDGLTPPPHYDKLDF